MTKEQIYNLLKEVELKNDTINHILEELAKDIELEKLSSDDAKEHLQKCWEIIKGFGEDYAAFYHEGKQIIYNHFIGVSLVKEDTLPNVPGNHIEYISSYCGMGVIDNFQKSIFASDIYILLTKDIKEDDDLTLVIDSKEIILDSKQLLDLLYLLGVQDADGVVLHYNANDLYRPLYIEKSNGSIGMIAPKTIMG